MNYWSPALAKTLEVRAIYRMSILGSQRKIHRIMSGSNCKDHWSSVDGCRFFYFQIILKFTLGGGLRPEIQYLN